MTRSIAFASILVFLVSFKLSSAQRAALTITSDPAGADVYIDDSRAGVTPLNTERPAPGSHRVRVVKVGYLENVRVVDLAVDQPAAIRVKLTRDPSAAPHDNWFVRRKWIWIGAAAGGAASVIALARRDTAPPTAGSVVVSPSIGLQGGTAFVFASQGASDNRGAPLQYAWNFGDGSTGSGPLVMHVYNAAGAFTAGVTVSDGKHSVTASGPAVVVRDLAETWRGTIVGAEVTLTLTQRGTEVSGTYREPGATGTITGTVRSTAPRISLAIDTSAFSASYSADPNGTIDILTGVYREQGLALNLILTRQ